jgi:hypothetical protein
MSTFNIPPLLLRDMLDSYKFGQINLTKNVDLFLRETHTYIMYLPRLNTYLHVMCTGKAIRASDMKILAEEKDGVITKYDEENMCTISYNYENFDKIYYESFTIHDPCVLYGLI